MTEEELGHLLIKREKEARWLWENSHDEARSQIMKRALNVYFRYRVLFTEWVEENLEPDAEFVFEVLRKAEQSSKQ